MLKYVTNFTGIQEETSKQAIKPTGSNIAMLTKNKKSAQQHFYNEVHKFMNSPVNWFNSRINLKLNK